LIKYQNIGIAPKKQKLSCWRVNRSAWIARPFCYNQFQTTHQSFRRLTVKALKTSASIFHEIAPLVIDDNLLTDIIGAQ
jgi:hypothetical protein